jgi:hypothetical protein
MVIIDQAVAGAAAQTIITSAMTASVPGAGQTFTVDDATGYPVTGRFTVVIDRESANEEKILVASRSGVTFTVATRGYDGTSASSHTSGEATCEHHLPATLIQFVIDHVDDVETDPHSTKLLNNARHDVEARHQFGSGLAFGVPVTPTALTPDIAGAAGTGNNPAREDHAHNVPTAAAVTSGLANAEGTGASFARNDHTHDQAALSVNTAELVDLAVTTAKLADLGVTSGKLAPNSVIAGKIAAGAISETTDVADGIVTLAKMASEASTDFVGSVTFTNPSVNFVLGTGGVRFANYFKIGRIVVYWVHFTLGTSGNITAGGTIEVNLPVPATADHRGFAAAKARQNGGLVASGTAAIGVSATVVTNFVTAGVSASWDATAPFNWDAGDAFDAIIVYEAAA